MLSDFEGHPVLVPDDCWLRNALGFTVYRDGIITRYCGVDGMLNDSWNLEGCKEEKRGKKLLAKKCFVSVSPSPRPQSRFKFN